MKICERFMWFFSLKVHWRLWGYRFYLWRYWRLPLSNSQAHFYSDMQKRVGRAVLSGTLSGNTDQLQPMGPVRAADGAPKQHPGRDNQRGRGGDRAGLSTSLPPVLWAEEETQSCGDNAGWVRNSSSLGHFGYDSGPHDQGSVHHCWKYSPGG